jgi:hypothetical protein
MNEILPAITSMLNNLCKPSYIYIILNTLLLIPVTIQNILNIKQNKYCVGTFKCSVTSIIPIFIAKILFIIGWTFVLDLLCKKGYNNLSWIMLLLPFIPIILFVLFFIPIFLSNIVKQLFK